MKADISYKKKVCRWCGKRAFKKDFYSSWNEGFYYIHEKCKLNWMLKLLESIQSEGGKK